MKASIISLLLIGMAIASVIEQKNSEGHKQHLTVASLGGDPLFAKPVEGYPADTNLALTHSFVFGQQKHRSTGKHVHIATFEVDLLWIYILGGLIIIGVVVGIIICCCSGDSPAAAEPKKEPMMMDEENKEMMGDMDKMMEAADKME